MTTTLQQWPTVVEAVDFAAQTGLDIPVNTQTVLSRALDGAVAEFERRTRWAPFLSTGQSETRLFDTPAAALLDLKGGLLSVSALSVGGSPYTQGQNYWLLPINAPAETRPFTAIDFNAIREYGYGGGYGAGYGAGGYGGGLLNPLFFPGSGHQAISVTGVWGCYLSLPLDVKQAILAKSLASASRLFGIRISGGLQGWEEAGTSEKYAAAPLKGMADDLNAEFESCVMRYRRLVVA